MLASQLVHCYSLCSAGLLQLSQFRLVDYMVVGAVCVQHENPVASASRIDPYDNVTPRLELASELLSELAPGLVHRNVILPVPSPDLRISDSGESGRNGMIVASCINDNDFR